MKALRQLLILALLLSALPSGFAQSALDESGRQMIAPVPLSVLDEQARQRVGAKARVVLAEESADVFKGIETFELPESGRVPNYLRALATNPNAVRPFASLLKAFIYGGTIQPETKLIMALRIAQMHGSGYVATHLQRLLGAGGDGQALLECFRSNKLSDLKPADLIAVRYAELLTSDIHGVSDAEFQKARGYYNDSQIVELTFTVCFFNYFTRLCEGLALPVEAWALDAAIKPRIPAFSRSDLAVARVALISDDEMNATSAAMAAAKESASQQGGLGLGIANSQRAMLRVPALAQAWRSFGAAVRPSMKISREIQLHVSFAVSMANGCRYCTLHQVLGLRRLGVDPAKLVAMQKSDGALTKRELAAVRFARKLTRDPRSVTDADYETLRAEFGEQGALDVLMQTCNFNFMNRFTDGLRLPSEDEAIRVYREVYGTDFKKK
ncbi:MAG TPA: carboxymuconolactone decarboxylase family protein [Blastocatellia bacterium]|nr:carboxymuconolactone decarboxylase family protein [Blastocatellia bacterium]